MTREPVGGRGVQYQDLAWFSPAKVELEHVRKQAVATKPGPLGVDRGDEGVGFFELMQDALTSGAAGEEVGQRPVDPLEDRRSQEQTPDVGGLAIEHLGQQVFAHRAFGARKLCCEAHWIHVAAKRQRGQSQTRRPAFSPVDQLIERRISQIDARALKQHSRIDWRETQVVGANLSEVARQPDAVETDPHVMAREEDQSDGFGSTKNEQFELTQALVGSDLVEIIDDQPHPVLELTEITNQALDYGPAAE